jgi:hypothetical protein
MTTKATLILKISPEKVIECLSPEAIIKVTQNPCNSAFKSVNCMLYQVN